MPSIDDVFDQLKQANTNLANVHSDLGVVHDDLTKLRATAEDIKTTEEQIAALTTQLVALVQTTNTLVRYEIAQNQTLICIGEHVSRNTCGIWSEARTQTELQRQTLDRVDALAEMYETANPAAALELTRSRAARARLAECCEEKPTPPACTYEPCPAPPPLDGSSSSAPGGFRPPP